MLIESSRDLSAMKEVGWIDSQTEHIAVSTVIYTEDRPNPIIQNPAAAVCKVWGFSFLFRVDGLQIVLECRCGAFGILRSVVQADLILETVLATCSFNHPHGGYSTVSYAAIL